MFEISMLIEDIVFWFQDLFKYLPITLVKIFIFLLPILAGASLIVIIILVIKILIKIMKRLDEK